MNTKLEPVETGLVGNTKQPKKSHNKDKSLKTTKQIVQQKHWCFTLNNYSVDDITQILEILEIKSKKYIFQEERGENNTPHLQGYIECIKKCRPMELNLSKSIHWEKCNNIEASIKYCGKDDTRVGKIYKFGFPIELKTINILKQWQTSVCKLIDEEPDDRTINWIYDKYGNAGKTVFAKYLHVKKECIIATGGGNKDIACLISILQKEGRDLNKKTSFIFNFPRSSEGVSYKAIESVKDGLMTSVKYETSTLCFNNPHVWIFSNELPDLKKLSVDRWRLFIIKDNKLCNYIDPEKQQYNNDYGGLHFGGDDDGYSI